MGILASFRAVIITLGSSVSREGPVGEGIVRNLRLLWRILLRHGTVAVGTVEKSYGEI